MSRFQFFALLLVVVAETIRGGREAIHEVRVFVREYRNDPTRFWKHLHRAAMCACLCILAMALPTYYGLEGLHAATG